MLLLTSLKLSFTLRFQVNQLLLPNHPPTAIRNHEIFFQSVKKINNNIKKSVVTSSFYYLSKRKTTLFEASYFKFSQRFRHGPNSETYKQLILYLASRRYEPVDTSGRAAVKAPERKDLGHFVFFLNSLIRLYGLKNISNFPKRSS